MKTVFKIQSFILLFLFPLLLMSQSYYFLMEPSRDGKNEQILQLGENNGTKVLAMASCAQCMPAVYTYNASASKAASMEVYGVSGIYVIPYDGNSYIAVAPKSPLVGLGEGVWQTFQYSNFFSKERSKVKNMTKDIVEQWAITLSKRIMHGEVSNDKMDKGDNRYYSALQPSNVSSITISEKLVNIGSTTFHHFEELSKLLGVKVFSEHNNRREHVFIEGPESIIWAKYGHGHDLGKSIWGEQEKFNYYHKDQQKIRELLVNKNAQDAIDAKLQDWSLKAKQYRETQYAQKEKAEIKDRRLLSKGFSNLALEKQALTAAKSWANQYGWEETVINAYFMGNDWNIYRNSLTGVQLGRRISGVIVMKRRDGNCSFHHATFAQQFNGSGYQNVFVEGITPGQYMLLCENVN
ncbi:hypothetical protein [Croceitalea sp. MTPC5]|uniref:hypothetical protein n=1 Tax=Croceitalea sp. MTPC5 TaxID=3056565 RepID=UPI0030D59AE5